MLNLVDYSVSGFPLLFVGFLECLAVNWIYGELKLFEPSYISENSNCFLNIIKKNLTCYAIIYTIGVISSSLWKLLYANQNAHECIRLQLNDYL